MSDLFHLQCAILMLEKHDVYDLWWYKLYLNFTGRNERTVVMDKSKGEPVISVKTKSKERVCTHWPLSPLHLLHWVSELVTCVLLSSCKHFLSSLSCCCFPRAQRVETGSHRVKRRKTSCHSTRSRSRERGRGRDNERGRSERWRDADTRKDHAAKWQETISCHL